jgi:hypothetical protein
VDPSKQTLHDSTAKVANTLPYSGLGGFYFDGFHFGGLSSDNGIPFLSEEGEKWIQARTESAFASLKLHPRARWVQGEQGLKFSSCVDGTWQLPERSIVEIYFSIFCKSSKRYVFPIIDEFSFMDIVDRAYDARRNLECLEVIRAKACVLSFTSVMVHMEGKLDMHKSVDADQCAARVHRLMPQILAEATSESLQVCTMLVSSNELFQSELTTYSRMQCMYNIFAGNTKVAATFLSIACRFVFMLGAHMNPSDEEPTTSSTENARPTRHYLRRIFWHCYMYDKDICLRVGYPPMIDDDHCDLTLPPGYKQIDEFESFKDSRDHIPGDMRLTIIKSRVIKLLYCANAFRKSDAELLKDIRELDDELESWRTSLPQQYRPNLATSYRMNPDPVWNKSKKVHIIVIQLEYYFLLALIHSASGRCRAWVPSEMGHRTSVTSSQAIALQASRSTLVNLEAVAHVLNRGDFW